MNQNQYDLEIPEEELKKYVDDFRKFASRKKSRRYKQNKRQKLYNCLTKEELNKKSKQELAFLLYRLRKRIIDKSMRNEFKERLAIRSKDDLINEILAVDKSL